MNTSYGKTLPVLLPIVLTACGGGGPTQPTAVTPPTVATQPSPPINEQAYSIAGVVSDERGEPMPGAVVTMGHWLGGFVGFPSVLTDATGGYAVSFTATPLGNGFVARAQVVAEGYEEYWRSIMGATGGTTVIANFRLHRITRMIAGDSIALSVPPDTGECRGWVAEVCPFVRVTVPKDGNLRIEVIPSDGSAATPPVEICCVNGDERYGNPITVPVAAGVELEVKVGMRRGFTTIQSFLVKTSFDAF